MRRLSVANAFHALRAPYAPMTDETIDEHPQQPRGGYELLIKWTTKTDSLTGYGSTASFSAGLCVTRNYFGIRIRRQYRHVAHFGDFGRFFVALDALLPSPCLETVKEIVME